MARRPAAVDRFLQAKRLAVAGVSRDARQPANAIFRRLRSQVPHVFAINPNTDQVEGVRCFPDVLSLPEPVEGVVIATHPDVTGEVVRQCAQAGVARVWMHRSFGQGSVSDPSVAECERRGIECIVGGCPLMFCEPVDLAHKCMRWWLQRRGRVPA
jgi:predicted CoA-binding protein